MNKLQWLKQITEWHPELAEAWYWVGVEYLEQNEPMQAIVAFTEGLKLASDNEKPLFLQKLTLAAAQPEKPIDEIPVQQQVPIPVSTNHSSSKHFPFQVITGKKDDSQAADPEIISFKDVAGLSDLKKAIQMKIISPFYNQGLFSKFRKKAGGGVLLYGPPGCGKTFMAKATAGECHAKFFPIHITDILDPYIGVSERNLRDLFSKARSQKPSIVFIDELDAIGHDRAKSSSNFRGLVDTFLTEMEGIDTSTEQVLILGATNMPWDVDNALKRPGRFDRLIFVTPPDEEARENIFRLKLQGRFVDGIDFQTLAKRSEFFSGADIEQVCEHAVEIVLEEILDSNVERPVCMKDMEKAMDSISPSTLEWLRTAKNYVRYANQSGIYNDVEDYLRKYGKRL